MVEKRKKRKSFDVSYEEKILPASLIDATRQVSDFEKKELKPARRT